MDEFSLIDYLTKGFKTFQKNILYGIGDDCAVIKIGNKKILYTTDTMVEGDHFLKEWFSPEQIGQRLIETNVSDIAAMGGIPQYLFISLILDSNTADDWCKQVYRGINKTCHKYKISLLGGNITHGKTLSLTAGVIGTTKGKVLLRSGANANDLVAVTGDIGSACIARLLLKQKIVCPNVLFKRLSAPKARVDESLVIKKFASAMIDISDGIASEAKHIALSSGFGVLIDSKKIPFLSEAEKYAKKLKISLIECALRGGEDYELMFTISPANWLKLKKIYHLITPITVIGEILSEKKYIYINEKGQETLLPSGYNHLSENINI